MNTHKEFYDTIDSINNEIKLVDKHCRFITERIANKVRDKEGLIFTQYFDGFDKVYTSNDTMYENLIFEIKNEQFNLKYRVDSNGSYEDEDSIFTDVKDKELNITFIEDTTDINKILANYKYVRNIIYQTFKKQYNK